VQLLVLGGGQGALFHMQHVDSGRSVMYFGMSGWGLPEDLVQAAVPSIGCAAGYDQVEEEGMVVDLARWCPSKESVGQGLVRQGSSETERIVD